MNYPELNVDDVCKLLHLKHPRRIKNASLLFGLYFFAFHKI